MSEEKQIIYLDGVIQFKRKTKSEWEQENPTLLAGEIAIATDGGDVNFLKVGDGKTPWNSLPWKKGPQGPQGEQGPKGDSGVSNNTAASPAYITDGLGGTAKIVAMGDSGLENPYTAGELKIDVYGKNLFNLNSVPGLTRASISVSDNSFTVTATAAGSSNAIFSLNLAKGQTYYLSYISTRTGSSGGGIRILDADNNTSGGDVNVGTGGKTNVTFTAITSVMKLSCYAASPAAVGDSATFSFVTVSSAKVVNYPAEYTPYSLNSYTIPLTLADGTTEVIGVGCKLTLESDGKWYDDNAGDGKTVVDFSADTLAALDSAFQLPAGECNVYSNGDPGIYVGFLYHLNIKKYVDNKFAELQALTLDT